MLGFKGLAPYYLETDVALFLGESGRSALSDISLGLRLRHQFRREFAPYIGVKWS